MALQGKTSHLCTPAMMLTAGLGLGGCLKADPASVAKFVEHQTVKTDVLEGHVKRCTVNIAEHLGYGKPILESPADPAMASVARARNALAAQNATCSAASNAIAAHRALVATKVKSLSDFDKLEQRATAEILTVEEKVVACEKACVEIELAMTNLRDEHEETLAANEHRSKFHDHNSE